MVKEATQFPREEGRHAMKLSAPMLLSFNGGFVDTAGYLALQGLFTAHVTGNFVTFGASLVQGTSGAGAKLLALPVFCLMVILARLSRYRLMSLGLPIFEALIGFKLMLLAVAAALAITYGPFADGNSAAAIATGMTLVAAMAIQNAVQRVHMPKSPPTTLMTGTSTQMMLDIGDLIEGLPDQERPALRARLAAMSKSVGSFATGCALAALAILWFKMFAFIVPPVIGLAALIAPRPT
jgi:uncharacterized membrane protein YoaK (UPF0700 family)